MIFMDKILEVEKKYLEYTQKIIDLEIKKYKENENQAKKDSNKLSFEDRLKGMHLNLNSRLINAGENIFKLEKLKKVPYFGRIDYQNHTDEKAIPIYIGKSSVSHNGNIVVYDWRSPICSLYYDSEIGDVSYNSLSGIQLGKLLLKRQIIIKNGELINAVDSNLATDDELLLPYLETNVDNKMKTIIASIQKEQNSIIRADNKDLIIQGVAGSGKTSVALHRIAYLIYLNSNKVKANDFLIIGPNNYFLNYISSVLPDLETTPVEQKTLLDLMNEYVGTNLELEDESLPNSEEKIKMKKNISSFKGSLEYCQLLNEFIAKNFRDNVEDFKIDDKVVFSSDIIRKRLFGEDNQSYDFERTCKYFKNLFKEKVEDIYEYLNQEYKSVYTSLPMGNAKREEYVEKSNNLSKLVKQKGTKLLDNYFKSINKSCLSLYTLFIKDLSNKQTSLTPEEVTLLQKETLKSLRKKRILFEDISAMLYLKYLLTHKKLNQTNVIIDEAQDYSMLTYYVLKEIFSNATFNIYGDIAQSLYPYRSINSWEELNKKVFNNQCDLLELSKSYRTTIEITETSNNILNALGLNLANPVIRHGVKVDYIDDNIEDKINKIKEWLNFGYQTIAVICKDELEASKVQEELIKRGINSTYVSNKNSQYNGKVLVLSVASSKGLEFDCTIINNASSKNYDVSNDIDMHLLYVAMTRALHEQVVSFNKELTKPLQGEIQTDKILKKQKTDYVKIF